METAKGREIKFRAWTGTEMIYEGFHISAPGIAWSWVDFTATDSKALGFPVMQYTGLLDKNGVEIYESDIVTFSTRRYHLGVDKGLQTIKFKSVVTWDAGGFAVSENQENDTMLYAHEYEVIGNLYTNPELLITKI